ncbi:MAG: DUF5691 domain-containing protein [Roseiarcus sp.]
MPVAGASGAAEEAEAFARLRRAFIAGLARTSPPLDLAFGGRLDPAGPGAPLKALALAGQRLRFRRPAAVFAPMARAAPSRDGRAIVPDAARRPLEALLSGRDGAATDLAAMAVADALDRARLRLHPFDLARLEAFVTHHADRLGVEAQAFVDDKAGRKHAGAVWFEADAIDATNWREARRAHRLAFFQKLRRADPAGARELLQRDLAAFGADVRAPLLHALHAGLGPDDRPFLESLAGDRAPGVRATAKAMLARLPGAPEYEARLADILSRFKISAAAAPGGRAWIRLEAPANVAGPARTAWAMDELQGVGLLRLAAALGASPDALVAAAEGDAPLLATLALLASEDMAFEALAAITGSRAADACFAILARADALPQIFGERVNAIAWTRAAIQPSLWRETPPAAALAQLYAALRGPLPEAVGAALLDAPCWRAGLAGEAGAIASPSSETLAAAAALTPAPCRPALARQLAQAVDGRARRAQRLLEILALLEPGQPESDP